jgi:hypothetical protein
METPVRTIEPLERREFDAESLMRDHPPRMRDPNKRLVLSIACPAGTAGEGPIGYSRWPEMPMPPLSDAPRSADLLTVRDGFFSYVPLLEPGAAIEWHVNFADPDLFGFYGSRAFAQDEMQVAEHPILGSLREAIPALGLRPVTVEHGRATPVLVTGAQRRVRVATEPNDAEGRPHGLYGRNFPAASPEAVRRAVAVLQPPTISNILAIAAPAYGRGRYVAADVEAALAAAFSGFRAAILESARMAGPEKPVVVHTGFWGAGAFGGDAALMSLVQLLAARMAGLSHVVHYAGSPSRRPSLDAALGRLAEMASRTLAPQELVDAIVAMGFSWRGGDGN